MRSIWSGAIRFGLIYIPVKLYKASENESLSFNLLRRQDLCRIRYARICGETGEEVPYEDIVRGYEYDKDEYVVLEDEDFKRANVRKTSTIDIMSFTNLAEIDEKYVERPYYIEPEPEAQEAYALLREALKRSGKVGIGRFVLNTREHLALIKAEDNVIILNQMRFQNEIRSPEGLNLPSSEDVTLRELDMATELIDQLTEPWRPEQYHDTYIEDLQRIIQKKIEGKEPEPVEERKEPVEVTDLFSQLQASLEMAEDEKKGK